MRYLLVSLLGFLVFATRIPVCAAATSPTFPLTYTLPRDARVSVLIADAHGAVVRELLHAAPRKRGVNREIWDGRDDAGQPAPAGAYTWKLLATQGLRAEYLLTLGTNPTPKYDTWPGNHGGASAVCADASGVYIAGGCGEGDPLLIKQTSDGRRLWSVPHWLDAWMGGYSLAVSGGTVYLLQQNGVVQCIDAATGTPTARWDLIWTEADRQEGRDTHLTMDLAASRGQVVVSYTNHDAIRWIDPATGKVLGEAAVPSPTGLTLDAAGRVLVLSKNAVYTLTRTDLTPRTLITGLIDPWRLDVDPRNGDILIAERGVSQQVKRFAVDGTQRAAYGTPGGRPREGRYDPRGFADIDDLAAAPSGGFYIVEAWTAPRRTASFAADGQFLREWYGGQQYANLATADPEDPRTVWVESHWGNLIQARVDYVSKTWSVYATYTYAGLAEGMVPNHYHGHSGWAVRHRDGMTYLCRETGFPCVLAVDEAQRRLVPKTVAYIQGRPDLPIVKEAFARPGAVAPGANLVVWVDRNNDGKASADEITGEVAPEIWGSGHPYYAADFTCYTPRVNTWNDRTGISVIPVKTWLPGGVPVYAFGKSITNMENYPDSFREMQTWGVAADHHGNLYGAFDTRVFAPFGAGAGANVGGNRVVKFSPQGKILWVVGRHAAASTPEPGEVETFYSMASAHDCAIASDYADSMLHVWDQDGLWVGRLLEFPDLTKAPKQAYTLCGENFGNTIYEVPAGQQIPGLHPGDVLLFGGGQNNTPVYRITGWDQFLRRQGALTITPAQGTTVTAQVHAETARPDLVHIPYLRDIKLNGQLEAWKAITPLRIMDGHTLRAEVWLAWNNSGLYAAYRVHTDTPWKSTSTPSLAFQGGAAVDLQYGPLLPARDVATAGDTRVVAAPLRGVTTAVEFLPVLATGMADGQRAPATYETGQGKITFARVAPLGAEWAFSAPLLADQADPELKHDTPGGYLVEMRIPLYAPFTLRPGYQFRLDVSVILTDAEGLRSTVRLPWHSRQAADMTVNDTYTEAVLRPQHWGQAVLEQ